ncbi:MAG: hypothetical protein WC675_05290 [Patescibacteria group bacterium]|jgi:hypothetical protein
MARGKKSVDQKSKIKKFKVQDLPEDARKKILITSVTILTLIIFSIWLVYLKANFERANNQPPDEQWEQIKKDLSGFLETTGEDLNKLTNQVKQENESTTTPPSLLEETTQPTTTPNLSEKELEEIKNKLLEKTN